jgi:hypothetical protein
MIAAGWWLSGGDVAATNSAGVPIAIPTLAAAAMASAGSALATGKVKTQALGAALLLGAARCLVPVTAASPLDVASWIASPALRLGESILINACLVAMAIDLPDQPPAWGPAWPRAMSIMLPIPFLLSALAAIVWSRADGLLYSCGAVAVFLLAAQAVSLPRRLRRITLAGAAWSIVALIAIIISDHAVPALSASIFLVAAFGFSISCISAAKLWRAAMIATATCGALIGAAFLIGATT